ncbi:hypothetical protein DITRI_Ditri07aG0067500 [Diplodiscus trichospermus]
MGKALSRDGRTKLGMVASTMPFHSRWRGRRDYKGEALYVLPKQHIQPLDERMCMTNILAQNSIPSIDMSNWEDPQVAKSICDAALEWGFFQIVNHEVPVEVLENVKGATYRFFGLPTKVKNQYSEDHLHLAQVLAFKQKKSLSGKITLACFMSLKKRLLHCGLLSIEEASALWPPVCREQVLDHMKKSEVVIKQLLQNRYEDVHQKWIEGGNYKLCIEDVRGEIWDMVKPTDSLRITLADLLAC